MKPKAALMLSVLLNRFHGSGSAPYLQLLTEEEMAQVKEFEVEATDLNLQQPWQSLLSMHYSWMIEPLKKLTKELQVLIVSSFPENIQQKLAAQLQLQRLREGLSPAVQHIFLNYLYEKMQLKEALPLYLLPNSPFTILQTLSKQELIDVVDCLAMHDVAGELRQIVDKQQLARIFQVLTKKQQAYLKLVLHESDKSRAPRLGLDQWGGDPHRLLQVLHNRGMTRLSKALGAEHPDFILHLCYRLDIGRAKIIQNIGKQKESEPVIKALTLQVTNAMNFVRSNA